MPLQIQAMALEPLQSKPEQRFRRCVDWIQFTLRGVPIEEVKHMLNSCVIGAFVRLDYGLYRYRDRWDGPGHCKLLARSPVHHDEVHVLLPGAWCAAAGDNGCRGVLLWMSSNGGHATRIDIAVDDWWRLVTPAHVTAAIDNGELVSHAKQADGRRRLRGGNGETVYIGARTSRVMLRVYDKGAESKGRIDAIRWELELKKEAAEQAAYPIAIKSWPRLFSSYLQRFVDFRDATSNVRSNRRDRLHWWEEIMSDYEPAPPYVRDALYSAEKSRAWFEKFVMPTVAALVASEGGSYDFILEGLRSARERWTAKHRIIAGMEEV